MRLVLTILVLAAGLTLLRLARFDREAWLADYDALKRHMGTAYANLDWMRERRGLDTRALDRRTEAALRGARTDRGARKAIERFVAAFDDPHLRVERPAPAWWRRIERLWENGEPGLVPAGADGREACAAQGYRDSDPDFRFDVEALPEWRAAPYGPFPAGTFRLADGRWAAIVRIAELGEQRYPAVCAAAWDAAPPPGPCDDACQERFRATVHDSLTGRLAAAVRAVAHADVLVIDVTDNGGGTEWVERVGPLLTDRPLRAPPIGFVKHPHWTRRLEEQARGIGIDLSDPGMPAGVRDTLAEAYRRLERALELAGAPCDRGVVWAGGEDLPACGGIVAGALYGTGPFDWLPDGSLASVASREDVYAGPASGSPVWRGPLWVLVDGGTASAAEELPAVLADNGAARVVGEPTFGAGCGYTNGGLPFTLSHSDLVVWMPDCVRYRRDGANEVEGVRPDVAIPWSELDGAERARALAGALAAGGAAREP